MADTIREFEMPQDPGPYGNYKNLDGSPTSWIPDSTPSYNSGRKGIIESMLTADRPTAADTAQFEASLARAFAPSSHSSSEGGYPDITFFPARDPKPVQTPEEKAREDEEFKKSLGRLKIFYFWPIMLLRAGISWGLEKFNPSQDSDKIRLHANLLTGGVLTLAGTAATAGFILMASHDNSSTPLINYDNAPLVPPASAYQASVVFYTVANGGTALRKEADSAESMGTLAQGSCVVASVASDVKAQFLQAFAITADRTPLGYVSRPALESANDMDWLTCRAELN